MFSIPSSAIYLHSGSLLMVYKSIMATPPASYCIVLLNMDHGNINLYLHGRIKLSICIAYAKCTSVQWRLMESFFRASLLDCKWRSLHHQYRHQWRVQTRVKRACSAYTCPRRSLAWSVYLEQRGCLVQISICTLILRGSSVTLVSSDTFDMSFHIVSAYSACIPIYLNIGLIWYICVITTNILRYVTLADLFFFGTCPTLFFVNFCSCLWLWYMLSEKILTGRSAHCCRICFFPFYVKRISLQYSLHNACLRLSSILIEGFSSRYVYEHMLSRAFSSMAGRSAHCQIYIIFARFEHPGSSLHWQGARLTAKYIWVQN